MPEAEELELVPEDPGERLSQRYGTRRRGLWGERLSWRSDRIVSGLSDAEEEEEEEDGVINGEDPENTTAVTVRLCYTFPSQRFSRAIRFTVPNSALEDSTTLQVIYLSIHPSILKRFDHSRGKTSLF